MLGSELDAPPGAGGLSDEHGGVGAGRVEDSDRVGGELLGGVRRRPHWPAGSATSAPVEGDDPKVAGEVGDLHLPHPRVHDRPHRQQHHGRRTVAEDLVVEEHTVALDEPAGVRFPRPHRCPTMSRRATESANSRISRLILTGSRACGPCPEPSSSTTG